MTIADIRSECTEARHVRRDCQRPDDSNQPKSDTLAASGAASELPVRSRFARHPLVGGKTKTISTTPVEKPPGISSAICTYRHRGKGNDGKGYGHPYPMQDAQRAIKTLRARSEEWNIDPDRIGVIGFSAGGHLCSTLSTHFDDGDPSAKDPIERVSSRPDFAILCYPVIAFDKEHTHKGSQRNLLGDAPASELIEELSNERQVRSKTPPTFLFHTAKDQAVPSDNSLHYYLACLKNGVPAELHIFPEGRHGLGLAKSQPGADQWPSLCRNWLMRIGMLNQD